MRLIRPKDLSSIDKDLLIDVYEESNEENAQALGLSLDEVKSSHLAYIEDEFLKDKGNFLYILEDKGRYMAALRLYGKILPI